MLHIAEIVSVACGGALGALARYSIQSLHVAAGGKIYLTLGINLAGCLLIGIAGALLSAIQAPAWLNRLVVAGFLGGFTTFSAFALESVTTMQAERWLEASLYIAASVTGGIILCALGIHVTRQIIG